jgi:hypothetical protein
MSKNFYLRIGGGEIVQGIMRDGDKKTEWKK